MSYDFSKTNILIVEETEEMLDLLMSVLRVFGVRNFFSAKDIDIYNNIFTPQKPDLIIIDYMVGESSYDEKAIDIVKAIRHGKTTADSYVPILMMSTAARKKTVIMSRDAGITEFVAVPFTAKGIYKKIELSIEKPRNFIKSKVFTGPCRRRKKIFWDFKERRVPKEVKDYSHLKQVTI